MLSVKLKEHFEKEGVIVEEKVYCINCEYYQGKTLRIQPLGISQLKEGCQLIIGKKDTPIEQVSIYAKPGEENMDNDCGYYKEKEEK